MGRYRGLPPELLEAMGLEPEGDEDEPEAVCGPYELPHVMEEVLASERVDGPGRDRPGGGVSLRGRSAPGAPDEATR